MKRFLSVLVSMSMVVSTVVCSGMGAVTVSAATKASVAKGTAEQSVQREDEQRVVALSVAIVEILDALEVPMVGIPTSTYTLPESVKDATEVGNPMSPDMEIIKSLDPSMVFSVVSLEATLKSKLDAVDIPSAFVNLNNFDGLLESIRIMGEETGRSKQAELIIEDMESRVAAVSEGIEDKEHPTVMLIFGASGSFQIGTEKSYVGDLIKRAGGINIITDVEAGFIPVDMEYLADKNPEYILLMTHANPEESKAAFEKEFGDNAAWDNFDAVKNEKVIALETSYFGMSANLLAPEAIEKLEAIFYE